MTISWNYQKSKQNKQIFLHEESNHHYGGLEIYEKTYSSLSKMENASTDNVKFPRDGYLPKPENATRGEGDLEAGAEWGDPKKELMKKMD